MSMLFPRPWPLTLLMTALAGTGAAQAASYPERPITLIVPFAAGASADGIARLVGRGVSDRLGQPVVVENRPGGGGAVGLVTVARAAPDGYTIGLGATGAIAINPHLPESSTLKPLEELAPIAKLADIPLVLVASKASGLQDLQGLIARAKDGKDVVYGTSGQYTSQHLAGEVLGRTLGIPMSAVPYRGSNPAVTDVLGNQIDLAIVDLTSANPHIKAKNIQALGVTSAERSAVAPDIPTLAEAGATGYAATGWMGLFGPVGMPQDVTARLSDAVREALAEPAVRQQILDMSAEPGYADPAAFGAFTRQESARWAKAIAADTKAKP